MADLSILKRVFANYESTLKETSFDKTNNEYVCDSGEMVYNFEKYADEHNHQGKRFDAIYFDAANDIVYCIEFKNTQCSIGSSKKIKEKFIDGLKLLEKLFSDNELKLADYAFRCYVVFKALGKEAIKRYQEQGCKNELCSGLRAYLERDFEIKDVEVYAGQTNLYEAKYKELFPNSNWF